MIVVYYTSAYFLDISLDIINELKKHVELHVFIEVTAASKNLNLLNIGELPSRNKLVSANELLSNENYEQFKPYFDGAAGVHFVIHAHHSGLSFSTVQASRAVGEYVKVLKPDIIHFEAYTLRTIGLLPYLFYFKKVFLAIHDPLPHSGEKSWKIALPNLLFFSFPRKKYFLFYSKFAHDLFVNRYPKLKQAKLIIKMCAFSYYKRPIKMEDEKGSILFFGRISLYKGLRVLLDAINAVFAEYPEQSLIIAGKANGGFDYTVPQGIKKNINIINRHIPPMELIALINNSKFIVCPYLDATQSGVLMTAYALNKPAVASNTGSFPEFIDDGVNGILVPPGNPERLTRGILNALNNNNYKHLADKVEQWNEVHTWSKSLAKLLNAYAC